MFKKVSLWKPTLFTCLVYCIVGIVMMIKPEFIGNLLLKVIGILGVTGSGIMIYRYFDNKNQENDGLASLIVGIIIGVLSTAALFIPDKAIKMVLWISGAYFLLDGIFKIPAAIKLGREINGSAIIIVLSIIIPIILGLILMTSSIDSLQKIVFLFGLCLLITGLLDLFSIYHLNELINKK